MLRAASLALELPAGSDPIAEFRKALSPGEARYIPEALQTWEARLRPLDIVEPRYNGSEARRVRDAFAPIGTKMRPDMSPDQAQHWTAAMVAAFSDLPPWIAVEALDEARHIVFAFPSDMEKEVREIAERNLEKHRRAIRRLHAFLDWLHHKPVPQLEAPAEDQPPMSLDEVRKLASGPMGASLVRMGLKTNAIRSEDAELILGELSEGICTDEERFTGS